MKQETKEDKRTEKRKIGDIGENIACKFLMKRGFEIVEKNYLKKWGEIDIIARKGDKLHFVEVKSVTRESLKYVSPACPARETDSYRPEDNLHPWKLKRLSRVIQTYLLGYRGNKSVSLQKGGQAYETMSKSGETDWQFDVAVVYLDLKSMTARVNYMEDIIL
jgi:Holliday junction resolvase-like predicted endonuclease